MVSHIDIGAYLKYEICMDFTSCNVRALVAEVQNKNAKLRKVPQVAIGDRLS